jgi:hypothetical protein
VHEYARASALSLRPGKVAFLRIEHFTSDVHTWLRVLYRWMGLDPDRLDWRLVVQQVEAAEAEKAVVSSVLMVGGEKVAAHLRSNIPELQKHHFTRPGAPQTSPQGPSTVGGAETREEEAASFAETTQEEGESQTYSGKEFSFADEEQEEEGESPSTPFRRRLMKGNPMYYRDRYM